jgi:hypothetical protein
MTRLLALCAAALFITATPLSAAPRVIEDPGKCAAIYPNANCQNYGPGNPYTSYGWSRGGWHHWHHRHYHHRRW